MRRENTWEELIASTLTLRIVHTLLGLLIHSTSNSPLMASLVQSPFSQAPTTWILPRHCITWQSHNAGIDADHQTTMNGATVKRDRVDQCPLGNASVAWCGRMEPYLTVFDIAWRSGGPFGHSTRDTKINAWRREDIRVASIWFIRAVIFTGPRTSCLPKCGCLVSDGQLNYFTEGEFITNL